jgi:hypothetical protein
VDGCFGCCSFFFNVSPLSDVRNLYCVPGAKFVVKSRRKHLSEYSSGKFSESSHTYGTRRGDTREFAPSDAVVSFFNIGGYSTGATAILIAEVLQLIGFLISMMRSLWVSSSDFLFNENSVCVLSRLILKASFVRSFLIYTNRITSFVNVSQKYWDDVEISSIQSFENCVSSISRWGSV